MAKRLPSATGQSLQSEQISEPACSTVFEQTNYANLPRIERLIRKDANFRTEAAIRSRK
jgi:hypothetical protein